MRIRYRLGIALTTAVGVVLLIYGVMSFRDLFRPQPLFQSIATHRWPILDMAFSSDGQRLITVGTGGVIRVWDVETGDAIAVLEQEATPRGVAVLPDSRDVVLILSEPLGWEGSRCEVVVWDTKSDRTRIASSFTHYGSAVADFSPDGTALAFVGNDGEVRVLQPVQNEETRSTIPAGHGAASHVHFSRDGKLLVVGYTDGAVLLWNREKAAATRLLLGQRALNALAIAPTGRYVASSRGE